MLMNCLSIIVRHSRVFSEKKLQEFDIGFPEQIILMYLSKNDNVNQDSIAKYFMIDKGAIAKTLSKLEKKGFIKRFQNKENKRENLISLSTKGVNIMGYMNNILSEWNEFIFDGLSKDDIKKFESITKIITNNVAKNISGNWSEINEE